MPSNVTKFIGAGARILQYHLYDANGYIAGPTGSVTKGANGVGPGRLLGIKTYPVAVPPPDAVPVSGDDAPLGTFLFPSAAVRSFLMKVAVADMTADGLFQSSNVVPRGNVSFQTYDLIDNVFPTVFLMLTEQAKSQITGSVGQAVWHTVVRPACQIQPLGRDGGFSERTAASYNYQVTASATDNTGWGETYSVVTHGTQGTYGLDFTTNYIPTAERMTGDGVTTVFNLLQTPASGTQNTDFLVFVNGIFQSSGITINQGLKTMTFGVAPANNAAIVVIYGFVI